MMRVLVVEADHDVRAYLVLLLKAMGHGAAGVVGVKALSRRLSRRAPDFVLCDANLPDGDGIAACRRIKRLRQDLQIVIMAWDQSGAVRARRAALGPVLIKPFSPPELMNALTITMLSRLNTRVALAVADLKAQNEQVRIQVGNSVVGLRDS